MILYNPKRIGRGIFFDGRKMSEGKVEISYNIPTTEAEITDFIRVVKELESQLKKVEMYCVEEECESIFPVKADGFLNLERMAINEGYVRYFIFSEDRLMDGLYDYDKFVQYMLEHGATYYDRSHILVPSMTKAQIEEMARVTGV